MVLRRGKMTLRQWKMALRRWKTVLRRWKTALRRQKVILRRWKVALQPGATLLSCQTGGVKLSGYDNRYRIRGRGGNYSDLSGLRRYDSIV